MSMTKNSLFLMKFEYYYNLQTNQLNYSCYLF